MDMRVENVHYEMPSIGYQKTTGFQIVVLFARRSVLLKVQLIH